MKGSLTGIWIGCSTGRPTRTLIKKEEYGEGTWRPAMARGRGMVGKGTDHQIIILLFIRAMPGTPAYTTIFFIFTTMHHWAWVWVTPLQDVLKISPQEKSSSVWWIPPGKNVDKTRKKHPLLFCWRLQKMLSGDDKSSGGCRNEEVQILVDVLQWFYSTASMQSGWKLLLLTWNVLL